MMKKRRMARFSCRSPRAASRGEPVSPLPARDDASAARRSTRPERSPTGGIPMGCGRRHHPGPRPLLGRKPQPPRPPRPETRRISVAVAEPGGPQDHVVEVAAPRADEVGERLGDGERDGLPLARKPLLSAASGLAIGGGGGAGRAYASSWTDGPSTPPTLRSSGAAARLALRAGTGEGGARREVRSRPACAGIMWPRERRAASAASDALRPTNLP